MSAADALVDKLPRTTLVVGKGGVGKTTCAAALAIHASVRIGRTLVVSTDPAKALPTVLDHPVESVPTPVRHSKQLEAQALDALVLRTRFIERWGKVLRTILDRGTYLDESDIGPLVDTALPGSDEIFAALALAELMAEERSELSAVRSGRKATDPPSAGTPTKRTAYERILVDTAPTGHTLRLLNLPRTFQALVRLLEAMQAKHRFMVRTLTRTYRSDEADAFLAEMNQLVSALDASLQDRRRCAAIVVSNPQPLVLEETRRYLDALRELHVHVAAIVWNAVDGNVPKLPIDGAKQYTVPKLDEWPIGRKGLERWLTALRQARAATPSAPVRRAPAQRAARKGQSAKPLRRPESNEGTLTALLRPLTIVAGKGGVGKTTVACALALRVAERQRTLVVSTDPAPSLADALTQSIPDADTPVEGVRNLLARQMDASAAFQRLRAEYESRVDALFDALIARGVDMSHDRAIARDLLSLAPPGIDEVYALSLIADALFKDNYECVVVDPAPTGHLLRLLEMPPLALAWSHQLLRLMLKYKDVTGLGETAQELLDFSRSLRAVETLLKDEARSAVVLVALDEPVVRAETERLAREVRDRGVRVSGVVLNRAIASSKRQTLPVKDAPMHFEAPTIDPAPVGVEALRQWVDAWRNGTPGKS